MTKFEELLQRYKTNGIRDDQLDGTGSTSGGLNYVSLKVITQAQANAIKLGLPDPLAASVV